MDETCGSCHARPDEPCEPSCECASCRARGVVEVTLSWAADVIRNDPSPVELSEVLAHLTSVLGNATDKEVRTEVAYKRLKSELSRDLPVSRAHSEAEGSDQFLWFKRARRNSDLCLEMIRTTKALLVARTAEERNA